MSGGILSILLLIEVVSVSGGLLKWFPPTIQYKSNKFGVSSGIRYVPRSASSPEQSEEKLNSSPDQSPSWKVIPWYYSFFNREASTESPLFIQNMETISPSLMSNFELMASTPQPKPRKFNPLCFFSALPCSSRKKGVYYRPRN
uniref:Uncharacterized protein n=1 Tax=Acrobeloides nanus TaxID=290746 RepID=A0A914ED94_9BILA